MNPISLMKMKSQENHFSQNALQNIVAWLIPNILFFTPIHVILYVGINWLNLT